MGQLLHGSARTTHAMRKEIQTSSESARILAKRYNINIKTVLKWKKRDTIEDASHRPKKLRTILSDVDEAIIVTFRKATQLPLDDCLDALIEQIPHLTRSNLYRCLKRYGISSLPKIEATQKEKKSFKPYPIGYIHIDITEFTLQAQKYYIFVGICRISKFAFVHVYERQTAENACDFLQKLQNACPFKIHTILTDNGTQFTYTSPIIIKRAKKRHPFDRLCSQMGIKHKTTKPYSPQTNGQVERYNRTLKEATLKAYKYQSLTQFINHLDDFILAYNVGKRLSALKRKTPMEFILNSYQNNPKIFLKNPNHLLLGPYT